MMSLTVLMVPVYSLTEHVFIRAYPGPDTVSTQKKQWRANETGRPLWRGQTVTESGRR